MRCMVEICRVKDNAALKKFIRFGRSLYRDNPYYVPELVMDEMTNLRGDKNPTFEYCESAYFTAVRDNETVGRIGAIRFFDVVPQKERDTARFTRVEFIDDEEVSAALFKAAEDWAREKGCSAIHGPLGFTDLDREGMLVEGFDRLATFVTIYNHPYYPSHLERLGYGKEADWVEYLIKVPETPNERVEKLCGRVMKQRDLTLFKYGKRSELKPCLEDLFALLNEAYADLHGVVPLTAALKDHYVKQFLPLVRPEYVKLIYDKNQKLAAFGVAMPSFSRAMQKCRGEIFPTGFFHMLRSIKKHDLIDLYLVAVRPDMQNLGLNAILMHEINKACVENGVKYAESSPELENNEKVRAFWKNYEAEQHKRRRCYVKQL